MTATSSAVDSSSPFALWKFEHVAVRVPDFETAVAWYVETLYFRLVKRASLGDKKYGFLVTPAVEAGFMIELIAGPGAQDRPSYQDVGSSLMLSGLHHVAFRVSRVDDTIKQLRDRGVTIVSEPHDVPQLGLRLAFFADPWGNLFEVIQAIEG